MTEISVITDENADSVTGDSINVTSSQCELLSETDRTKLIRRHEEFTLEILDQGVPDRWTESFVGERLVEAFRVLDRMPLGARQMKSGLWPNYQTMTRADLNEHLKAGTLEQFYSSRNRVRIPPSSHEIGRMEEAIAWPARYLQDDTQLAGIVNFWAFEADIYDEAPPLVRVGLRIIAKGLRRDLVMVR